MDAKNNHAYIKAKTGKAKQRVILTALLLIVLLVCAFSLVIGRYPIGFGELMFSIWQRITGVPGDAIVQSVIFDMRLPRIAAALLTGAALSGSGAAYQGVFRNPMVSPDLLGASAGASCGAALALLLSLPRAFVPVVAFIFGVAAVFFSWSLSAFLGKDRKGVLILVLCGMVVANLFTAGISIIKFVADPNSKLPEITFWLMGGLSSITVREVLILAVPFAVGGAALMLLRWKMNIMTFGDEEAAALGVNTQRTRLFIVLGATLMTSASVAVAGMVGWVGLIIPHLARRVTGSDFRFMLPVSILMGASFLLLVDNVARSVYTTEIPISILTSVIGAPLFVVLLRHQRHSHME